MKIRLELVELTPGWEFSKAVVIEEVEGRLELYWEDDGRVTRDRTLAVTTTNGVTVFRAEKME